MKYPEICIIYFSSLNLYSRFLVKYVSYCSKKKKDSAFSLLFYEHFKIKYCLKMTFHQTKLVILL